MTSFYAFLGDPREIWVSLFNGVRAKCSDSACQGAGLKWEADNSDYDFNDLNGNRVVAHDVANYECFSLAISRTYPFTSSNLVYNACHVKRMVVCQFKCN